MIEAGFIGTRLQAIAVTKGPRWPRQARISEPITPKSLIKHRKIDKTKHRRSLIEQTQGNAPDRNAPREVGCAINGINNPAPIIGGKNMLGFFCQDTMTGKFLGKAIAELLVCPLIRLSDKGSVPFSCLLYTSDAADE